MEDDVTTDDEEPKFEMTPEEATNLESGGSPGLFNRKRTLIFICVALAVTVCGGVIINLAKSSKKSNSSQTDEYAQSRSNTAFVASLRDSARRNAVSGEENFQAVAADEQEENKIPEPALPPVSFDRQNQEPAYPPPAPYGGQPVSQSPPQQASRQPDTSHFRSSLVPQVQGSLFNGQNASRNNVQQTSADSYDDYLSSLNARAASYASPAQGNAGQSNQDFYQSTNSSSAVYNGQFLGENCLWTGAVIPGILETSINTSLPGQVLARVTQNVYDSLTGRVLLIPQGTLLIARYNSSVSYAQSRIQIVWDTLIRPDGFQIDLEGANGVDRAGMSGQEANSKGNFFEYLKAAGVITIFSIANAKFTETVNKFGSSGETAAANAAQANANFFNQLGSELTSQAMNVQPVLTVENGTLINIMLNKTIYLPPLKAFTPSQKYILE